MSLPPLANFLAVHRDDPRAADALERAFLADGRFGCVLRPAPGWVVAVAPLPHGRPDPPAVADAGLIFAEGRDACGATSAAGITQVARLARDAPERLARLQGDFTFLLLGDDGRATGVRSAGGLVALYRTQTADAWSTRLGWLVAFGLVAPSIDPFPLATWVAFGACLPQGRAFLRGVSLVERGGYVQAHRSGIASLGRYWDPRPDRLQAATPARLREHAERLRASLLGRLQADLDPAGGNLLSLSGGIDSSSLLGLVGTLGLPVSAVSLVPEDPARLAFELGYLRSAVERTPLETHRCLPFGVRRWMERARDASSPGFPVLHPILHVLPGIAANSDVRVLFGGEFGDEIGGSLHTLPDWVAHTPVWRLLRVSQLPRGRRDLVAWPRRRLRERFLGPTDLWPGALPVWAHTDVRAEFADWRSDALRHARNDDRPLRRLALRSAMDGFLPMNWEACSQVQIRRSVPFFTREVLELAFDCHPGELVGPGYRRLERAALADDVSASNLQRQDPGRWDSDDDVLVPWHEPIPPALAATVSPEVFTEPGVSPSTAGRLWIMARFADYLYRTGKKDQWVN